MKAVQIVPISEEHIEGFHTYLDAVAREGKYVSRMEAPPLEAVGKFVRDNITRDVAQLVALDAGVVVGWCDVIPNSIDSFKHSGGLGKGVAKDYRGQGIGERLAREAIIKVKANGLERIELSVFASNMAACKLYEKLGFIVEGTKKRAVKLDNNYDAVIDRSCFWMQT